MDNIREALKRERRGPQELLLGVCDCLSDNRLGWNEKGRHKKQMKNVVTYVNRVLVLKWSGLLEGYSLEIGYVRVGPLVADFGGTFRRSCFGILAKDSDEATTIEKIKFL